jgi:hypothetical protein
LATSSCQLPRISLERLVNPTDKQREFLKSIAEKDFVLYGGEAGGGKSYILRWWLILYLVWCWKVLHLRGVVVGLFCEDYPNLYDRQISKLEKEVPAWLGRVTYRKTCNLELRAEYGGGVIALRNLDKLEKYKSAEFAAIAVDELTLNRLHVFNWLRFRLRWPGVERPKFAAATNPGGPGHDWVKRYWHDRKFPDEFHKPVDITDQFVLVRAKSADNPHVPAGYHDRLLTLPPDMARMVGRGDWNVYTGQYFPQFESVPGRHVLKDGEAVRQVKPWHTRWISGDWGYEHPACFHWHAKNENNRIVTYDEMWDRRVGESEWAQRITAREQQWKERFGSSYRPLTSFPFSWDAGRQSPRSQPKYPKSIVQLLSDHLGVNVPKPHPADSSPGSRMSGFRLMSQLLDADLWGISDACPKLIECLPTLIRDEDDTETLLKVDYAEGDTIGDDPADSVRMGLQHEFGSSVVPVNVMADRRVAAYAEARGQEVEDLDPNAVHMLHRQAMVREQQARRKRRGGLGRIWRPRS